MPKKYQLILGLSLVLFLLPQATFTMHIMEGFLPLVWCISWGALSLPFIILGFFSIQKTIKTNPRLKMLLAMAGAFTFVLSALKLPSVTGSCSHPTGVGLGAILFGPTPMAVLGLIVLIFQAILLAHGGLNTLGANTFSMAIVGPFVAFSIYKLFKKLGIPMGLSVFIAATLGELLTYVTASFQLSLAYPSPTGGFSESLVKFMGIFAVTQLPLAISEGILTVIVFNVLKTYSSNELRDLNIIAEEAPI